MAAEGRSLVLKRSNRGIMRSSPDDDSLIVKISLRNPSYLTPTRTLGFLFDMITDDKFNDTLKQLLAQKPKPQEDVKDEAESNRESE